MGEAPKEKKHSSADFGAGFPLLAVTLYVRPHLCVCSLHGCLHGDQLSYMSACTPHFTFRQINKEKQTEGDLLGLLLGRKTASNVSP